MEYPQSGERIVGGDNRRAVYAAFPVLPKVERRRLLVSGDLAVLEASLDYGDDTDWRAVLIFELRDGRIVKETAYLGAALRAGRVARRVGRPIDASG
jgi:hypothetical protein